MLRKLQKVQNAAMGIELNERDKYKPMIELLNETIRMSIHQTMTMSIIRQARKMIQKETPKKLLNLITTTEDRNGEPKYRSGMNNLNIKDNGFIYKAVKILNWCPNSILLEDNPKRFKCKATEWIKMNINQKPY